MHKRTPGIGLLFVLLWSTGFIGAKLGLPYAEPLTFLALRMGLVVALLLVVSLASRVPRGRAARGHGCTSPSPASSCNAVIWAECSAPSIKACPPAWLR